MSVGMASLGMLKGLASYQVQLSPSPPTCSIHTFASWLSLLPTKIWYDSFWAHTAIIIFIMFVATWNGASFYFRVGSRRERGRGCPCGNSRPLLLAVLQRSASQRACRHRLSVVFARLC